MKSTGHLHIVALFALRCPPADGSGLWLRFVGRVDQLPIRPFWEESFAYEDYLGKARPGTLQLCKRLGIDVLFVVHVQRNARGNLFRERMEEIRHGVVTAASR
jgi:hypothetical protein